MRTRLRLKTSTLLCLAGLVVAGIGLAYCVHLGAQRDDSEDSETSAAALEYLTASSTPSAAPGAPVVSAPTEVSRSKMLLGTVDSVASSQIVLQMKDGRTHTIGLTDSTHYESPHADSPVPVKVGDLVVVHVMVEGERMTADLVVDGRVTTPTP
ncbi:MAG: hypothetical protein INR72_04775 [Williamsia herbipolensis]|uniref:DUF5666 domain-containing protein n=1 Tax=Williamsia serinedens TaxID=391736 RepID=A0ABT1H6X0_9NOCA|nr:hypothetical protein [Williamsia serinedens]MBE7160541.1 hypothetical protein [Williamsia herbipolensis]MCP2161617.1 hypothetical protein [Williamsia serinedens]